MKKILKHITAGIIILLPVFSSAQNFTDDVVSYYPLAPSVQGLFSPTCASPNLYYIKVNFHFMLKDDGTGNFTEYDDGNGDTWNNGYTYAQDVIYYSNLKLANNVQMKLPSGNTTSVDPIPFRFVLCGVYFHRDTKNYVYNHIDFIVNNIYGINALNEVNVYALDDGTSGVGGVTQLSPHTQNPIKLASPWRDHITGGGAWKFGGCLNHEIGHVLGLNHAWNSCPGLGDNCADTPDNPNCWGYDPNITKCLNYVNCNPNNGCAVYSTCAFSSNNVMDYNQEQDSWTPCQLSTATSYLQSTAFTPFASCCPATPAKVVFDLPSHVCDSRTSVILDGSFRTVQVETGYTIEIFQTDKIGGTTQLGGYWTQSFTGQYGQINLSNLYSFVPGNIYGVKLTVSDACAGNTSGIKYVYVINNPNDLYFQNASLSELENDYTIPDAFFGSDVTGTIASGPYAVSSSGNLTVKANEVISLNPGTSFEQGSNVSLSIKSMVCPGNNYRKAFTNNSSRNILVNSSPIDAKSICEIYPNPSDGSFTVGLKEAFTIVISNLQGKEIYSGSFPEGADPVVILRDGLSGVYYCKIMTKEKTYNQKIVFLK
jgi:hypothetical protein